MNAINFVARPVAGNSIHGEISVDGGNAIIDAAGMPEISLNLRQSDIRGYARAGNDLEITLADGRIIALTDYFDGGDTRLFISADGYLNEVTLADAGDGTLYAQYGPTAEWGKWSPSDDLIFLDGTDVASAATGEDETATMLGAGILGGGSLLGLGAGTAAVVAGSQLVDGGGGGGGGGVPGGGGPARIPPSLDQDQAIVIGGDDVDPAAAEIALSGGGQPGASVEVTIGHRTQTTEIGEDGKWTLNFAGDDFPADGEYDISVKVTEPDGTETVLGGPDVLIDTAPPDALLTGGTVGTGDLFNAEAFEGGVRITGTGEVGATITATVDGVIRETVVDRDGAWSVTYEKGALRTGEYVADMTLVASDALGNTTTLTDDVRIDTAANDVTIDAARIEGDGTVNKDEARDGIDLVGTATPGAEVVVEFGGASQTVIANGAGNWSAKFDGGGLASGAYDMDITATSTDAAGNVSSVVEQIHIDNVVQDFAQTSSTGGKDGVINEAEAGNGATVTGTGEPGMRVTVELAGARVDAVVADDGSWTAQFVPGQIPAGTRTETMIATATDLVGNVDTITTPVEIDTEAGHLTLNAREIGGEGTINSDDAKAGVLVTGKAPEGMLVTVILDGVRHEVLAGAGDTWQTTYQQHEIRQGTHDPDVSASITDAAGNSAQVDASVHVDTQVDNLHLNTPGFATATDGTSVINGAVNRAGFELTGTVEPGSTVRVSVDGVTQAASVDDAGNWTAVYGGNSLRGGSYDADIRVDVRDPAGNVSSLTDSVRVDTRVDTLSHADDRFGGDRIVDATDAKGGITLTGEVEPGSAVKINVLGRSYDAIVAANGAWTLDIPEADIPQADDTYTMTVTATDSALNQTMITDTLTVDTVVPDHLDVVGYFRQGGGYRSVTLGTPDDPVAIHKVAGDGTVSELKVHESVDAFLGETDYHFLDAAGKASAIPDGSQLVVTSSDRAGNSSSTYIVLDETNTNVVNVGGDNLSGFQVEAIDLSFGDQSQLTLTKELVERLSDTTDTLVVHGGADDTVTMLGAARGGGTMVDGEAHSIYTLGDATQILVDDEITNVVI